MNDNHTAEPSAPSYFAPAERASGEELHHGIETVSRHPLTTGLLEAVYGLLAVLNPQRQILAVNDLLLTTLGVNEAGRLLGLRPGEAVECVHAREEPGGCGTSRFCSACGAAIAIVASLGTDRPCERECAITAERDGKRADFYFSVRCCPLVVDGQRFLLLFLRDISAEQQRAALERVFYHDVSNLIENLLINSRSLRIRQQDVELQGLAGQVEDLANRLATEVRIQKAIARGSEDFGVMTRPVLLERALSDLQRFFASHPAAAGKTLRIPQSPPAVRLSTDVCLLERVLMNMLTNALEATAAGGEVKFWIEDGQDAVTFCVWNRGSIADDVARRIFQRNFSTKDGDGRGLGTYAMKLLGENYLRGKVSFASSAADGTVFRYWLPKTPPAHGQPA